MRERRKQGKEDKKDQLARGAQTDACDFAYVIILGKQGGWAVADITGDNIAYTFSLQSSY